MNCPYCSAQMKKGEIHFSTLSPFKILLYGEWLPKDDNKNKLKKRNKKEAVKIEDFGLDFFTGSFDKSYYCSECKKIITEFSAKE